MSDRLFKRGDIWYAWCFDADGRRIQRSTKCRDRKAAEAALRELERRAADPAYAASNQATLAEALCGLVRDRKLKGRAEGTLDCYQVKAGHLLRILDDRPLARIDARAVDAFIDQRLRKTRVGTRSRKS
jgi:hypothetical protein